MNGCAFFTIFLTVVIAAATAASASSLDSEKQQKQEQKPVFSVVAMVKNEASIIPRLLASVVSVAEFVCLCDTGSSDRTPEVAGSWLRQHAPNVKVQIHRDEWVNFARNRNQCLLHARRQLADAGVTDSGFFLLMDADFELVIVNRTRLINEMPPGVLNMIDYDGALDMRQPLLISAGYDCGYRLVTHEALMCLSNPDAYRKLMLSPDLITAERILVESSIDQGASVRRYSAIRVRHHRDGKNREDKFTRDITLLQNHLLNYDPDDARAWFYLARSLEDNSEFTRAFNAYYKVFSLTCTLFLTYQKKRVMLGGSFIEEIWYSTMKLGSCLIANGTEIETAARYFVDAFNYRPNRREPLYYLTRGYRVRQKYTACKLYGYHALTVPLEGAIRTDDLFINVPVYEWYIHDELAVCLAHLGEYTQSAYYLNSILNANPPLQTLDPENRKRLQENLDKMRINTENAKK